MRADILGAAEEILKQGGLNGVSIRKIADRIEYSPAIVYHYFKSKEEIIDLLIANEYQKIIGCFSDIKDSGRTPEQELKESAKRFVNLSVQMGDSYQSVMLSRSPAVLSKTSVLQKGAAKERPAVAMLCAAIGKLPALAGKSGEEVERTAQIIWSAAFGLSLRLTVEQVDEHQREQLIDHLSEFVFAALK